LCSNIGGAGCIHQLFRGQDGAGRNHTVLSVSLAGLVQPATDQIIPSVEHYALAADYVLVSAP
jgi:hypothetical protein